MFGSNKPEHVLSYFPTICRSNHGSRADEQRKSSLAPFFILAPFLINPDATRPQFSIGKMKNQNVPFSPRRDFVHGRPNDLPSLKELLSAINPLRQIV